MAVIGERVIEWLGGMTRVEHEAAVTRAYEAGFGDGNDEPNDGTGKRMGYRSMSKKLRDFSKAKPEELLNTVWSLWQSSPVAKRVMTLKRDHISGRNVTPVVTGDDDDAAAELVDSFWSDNQLDHRSSEFTLQLFLFGEQCYSVFVRESDGRVRLGYIDPVHITEVICHPGNALEMWAVGVGNFKAKNAGAVYRVVRVDDEVVIDDMVVQPRHPGKLVMHNQANLEPWELDMLQEFGFTDYNGSVILTRVNCMSNQGRGVSDLVQVADWIDQADETLFALGDREQYADFFSWDITLVGAGPDIVKKRWAEITANPPKKGSFNVHNDSEIWELKYPELRQEGSIATFRAMLGLILGGIGFPVHWFGYGDDANRATALAQGDPTLRSLEHDQAIVREMFTTILQFVVDQAEIARNLQPNEDRKVDVQMPELSRKDLSALVPLFGPYAIALLTAVEAGFMTTETAAKAWAKLMAEVGIEIDPTTELEAVAAAGDELVQAQNDELAGRLDTIANDPDGRLTPGDISADVVLNGS